MLDGSFVAVMTVFHELYPHPRVRLLINYAISPGPNGSDAAPSVHRTKYPGLFYELLPDYDVSFIEVIIGSNAYSGGTYVRGGHCLSSIISEMCHS